MDRVVGPAVCTLVHMVRGNLIGPAVCTLVHMVHGGLQCPCYGTGSPYFGLRGLRRPVADVLFGPRGPRCVAGVRGPAGRRRGRAVARTADRGRRAQRERLRLHTASLHRLPARVGLPRRRPGGWLHWVASWCGFTDSPCSFMLWLRGVASLTHRVASCCGFVVWLYRLTMWLHHVAALYCFIVWLHWVG